MSPQGEGMREPLNCGFYTHEFNFESTVFENKRCTCMEHDGLYLVVIS